MSHMDPIQTVHPSHSVDGPRLLIAHTDMQRATLLKQYMERQGLAVCTVLGGQEAIATVYQDKPDVIILDIPDLESLQICQGLKQDATLGYLPIIIVTEQHERRKELTARLAGADDYVSKPVNEQELFQRVMTLVRIKVQIDRLYTENQDLNHHLQDQNERLQQTLDELKTAIEAAKEAELLKKHIIESVDHELRTPMLQTKSAVAILVDVIRELSPDEKQDTVARMATQAVARMEELIQNISQLHLIDHIKLIPMIANDAVTQSINALRRSWAQRDKLERVRYTPQKNLPPVVGDRRAVARILFLLLDNALKFSPPDSPVDIHIDVNQDTLTFAVQDYGIGIPLEFHSRIFDAFFTIDRGTQKQYGGVGVGLASAQIFARQMNTEIFVSSKPNKGSTFYFNLPIADLNS